MYKVIHFPNILSLLHIHLSVQACITANSHPSEERDFLRRFHCFQGRSFTGISRAFVVFV